MTGQIQCDMLECLQRSQRLRCYSVRYNECILYEIKDVAKEREERRLMLQLNSGGLEHFKHPDNFDEVRGQI